MEDRAKQTEAFIHMLETMGVPAAERPQIMRGVEMFFDRGWPSNQVTVGMAARAGAGLVPSAYEGISNGRLRLRRSLLSLGVPTNTSVKSDKDQGPVDRRFT